MRTCALLAMIVLSSAAASADVSVEVYLPDGQTPLGPIEPNLIKVYPDIMVGTRLVLVVHSDVAGPWWGALLMTWDNRVVGDISARGENSGPPLYEYEDSVREAAGRLASVIEYGDTLVGGFDLVAYSEAVPGEWFILDYHAVELGLCYVGLYDLDVSYDIPLETLLFSHVPSRDFNADTLVNFADLALLASWWGQEMPLSPAAERAFDLDADGYIGPADMALFSEFWLARTDCNEPPTDTNTLLP